MSAERLDKLIAMGHSLSRADAKRLIASGAVMVNGQNTREIAARFDPEIALICVNGIALCYRKHLYILMNKPLGVVSSTDDPDSQTVISLLPEALSRRGLFPAGRLDKYSEGMMVLTDDGNFAHRLLSPNRHVPKTYYVEVDQPVVTPQLVLRFREGVFLGDGEHASPAHLEMLSSTSANVTIFEGLYHQVRRMFDHNGAHVTRLVRIRMGNLDLDPMLAAGQCRLLTEMERTQLLGPF